MVRYIAFVVFTVLLVMLVLRIVEYGRVNRALDTCLKKKLEI